MCVGECVVVKKITHEMCSSEVHYDGADLVDLEDIEEDSEELKAVKNEFAWH